MLVGEGTNERRVNGLNEGEFFGEMAVLTGEPRTATIRTTMPTQLYSLSRTDFHLLMQNVPEMREGVERTIAQRRVALEEAKVEVRAGVTRNGDGQAS